MVRQGGPQGCVLRRLTCRNNNDATGSITFGSTDGPMTMRQWCQPRARHPMGGSANRSLSHIEPVSGTPKRKLQNGEQRCSSRFTRVVKIAREKRVAAGRLMRVDTTAVETDIHHRTDSTLL